MRRVALVRDHAIDSRHHRSASVVDAVAKHDVAQEKPDDLCVGVCTDRSGGPALRRLALDSSARKQIGVDRRILESERVGRDIQLGVAQGPCRAVALDRERTNDSEDVDCRLDQRSRRGARQFGNHLAGVGVDDVVEDCRLGVPHCSRGPRQLLDVLDDVGQRPGLLVLVEVVVQSRGRFDRGRFLPSRLRGHIERPLRGDLRDCAQVLGRTERRVDGKAAVVLVQLDCDQRAVNRHLVDRLPVLHGSRVGQRYGLGSESQELARRLLALRIRELRHVVALQRSLKILVRCSIRVLCWQWRGRGRGTTGRRRRPGRQRALRSCRHLLGGVHGEPLHAIADSLDGLRRSLARRCLAART